MGGDMRVPANIQRLAQKFAHDEMQMHGEAATPQMAVSAAISGVYGLIAADAWRAALDEAAELMDAKDPDKPANWLVRRERASDAILGLKNADSGSIEPPTAAKTETENNE